MTWPTAANAPGGFLLVLQDGNGKAARLHFSHKVFLEVRANTRIGEYHVKYAAHPDETISSIDFVSAGLKSVRFCVAITAKEAD